MNFLFAIALLVVSYVIQVAITPKPEVPKAASIDEFDLPQMEEGTPQAVVFGDVWTPDWLVLWYGDLRTSPLRAGGGKK